MLTMVEVKSLMVFICLAFPITVDCGCNEHWSDFQNSVIQAGWDQLEGTYTVGPSGFRLFSNGGGSARIRLAGWNFGPPNGESENYIKVVFRGAPDSGKNSYVCLRDSRCSDNPSDNNCDEIDLVESYGADGRAEAMSYSRGPSGVIRGTLHTLTSSGSGNGFHTYELTQTPGNGYYTVCFDGGCQSFSDGPHADLMMLYIGIWDCSGSCGDHVAWDTYMEIQSVYAKQCF